MRTCSKGVTGIEDLGLALYVLVLDYTALSYFYMRTHQSLLYDIGQEPEEGSDTDRYQIPPVPNP